MALDVAQIAAWEWHMPPQLIIWPQIPRSCSGSPPGARPANTAPRANLHPDDKERQDTL